MERRELGSRKLGDQRGWDHRNLLKEAEAEFLHIIGSQEVAPKASTAPLGTRAPSVSSLCHI